MNNQMPYNMPPDGYKPQQSNNPVSGCSITSMILGIVAILFSCCLYYISIPCAIIGVILAAVGIKSGKGGKGMGIAGLVLSVVSLVPSVIIIVSGAAILETIGLF
ncbi:MAG: DUF4190 domain-containing protein [Ruminococcus flavefaciens]|nr:DUF4190 domain-containing protein [Ruminococcus flavefaciens]MCM1059144.1 DUF4190 domain-containing protein [Eubacterium sp.]